ncbi:2'-5' RNA ligase family protein [Francisellaceae bacterium CB300]
MKTKINIKKKLALIFFAIFLLFISTYIYTDKQTQYNVFLIPDNSATTYINKFNNQLANDGLLEKYNVLPFSKNHPTHLSLYITSFNKKSIDKITDIVKNISNDTKPFDITTNYITVGKSGFVMLDVNDSERLQYLSNTTVTKLSKYRDKDYPMPNWVKYYPEKEISFNKYGTPNAFEQFDPHFSILAKSLKNDKIKQTFVDDFNKAIRIFNPKPKKFKIIGIGFGEVDNNGQITKTIKKYIFKNKQKE